jgi:hypothetical protein
MRGKPVNRTVCIACGRATEPIVADGKLEAVPPVTARGRFIPHPPPPGDEHRVA